VKSLLVFYVIWCHQRFWFKHSWRFMTGSHMSLFLNIQWFLGEEKMTSSIWTSASLTCVNTSCFIQRLELNSFRHLSLLSIHSFLLHSLKTELVRLWMLIILSGLETQQRPASVKYNKQFKCFTRLGLFLCCLYLLNIMPLLFLIYVLLEFCKI